MSAKRMTSLRLSTIADRQLTAITTETGMNQSEVINAAITHYYNYCGIPDPLPASYKSEEDMVRKVLLYRTDGRLIYRSDPIWWEAEAHRAGWALTVHTPTGSVSTTYGKDLARFIVALKEIEPDLDKWAKV